MWFKKKKYTNKRLNDIEDRLRRIECDHENIAFSGNGYFSLYKKSCVNCNKVIDSYGNRKDYLTAKNKYMAELIAKNEKIILDLGNEE